MRKKLIAALIAVSILLVAAIGVLLFLENSDVPEETVPSDAATTVPAASTSPIETTEETVGLTFATEGEDEKAPEFTWNEEHQESIGTAPTVDPDATFDPDENEIPGMPVD